MSESESIAGEREWMTVQERADETVTNIRAILSQSDDDDTVDLLQVVYQAIESLSWISGFAAGRDGRRRLR